MTVKGEVQGVNLRSRVREKAKELKLMGYVKNMADGSVQIEVEGEEAALDRLADWCRSDPGAARVDEVRVRDGVAENYTDFTVR